MMQRSMEVRTLDFRLAQQRELRMDWRRQPKKVLKAGSLLMIFSSAWLMTGSAWVRAIEKDNQQKQHPDVIGVRGCKDPGAVSAFRKKSKEMESRVFIDATSVAVEKAAVLQDVSPEQEAEQAAVEAIEELGGGVRYDGDGTSGTVVFVKMGRGLTDADLKKLMNPLKNLKKLTTLDLCVTGVTDAGLKELQDLKGLDSLMLNGTRVTDAGLKELKNLKRLRRLAISSTRVTDAGLKELRNLKGLRELHLGSKGVTDAGLKELRNLEGLRDLYLNNTRVTDAGLKELQNLKGLQLLFLNDTRVTDAGLKIIKELKGIQKLFLASTQITDAGLKELKDLKQLRLLSLTRTRVTEAGVAELKEALPDLRMEGS